MEKEIISIMSSRNLDKIHLEYLVDLGDEYDEDGEPFSITCNTLKIVNGEVVVYNDNNEDLDGSVDILDMYRFDELDDDQQKSALWALDATLEYLDKNNIK